MAVRKATGMGVLQAREFARTTDRVLLMRILHAGRVPCPEKLVSLPEELRERIFEASTKREDGHHLIDPIESDPVSGPVVQKVIEECHEEALAGHETWPRGICHLIWRRTKQRLSEEYGIEWYSPADMNPCSIFD